MEYVLYSYWYVVQVQVNRHMRATTIKSKAVPKCLQSDKHILIKLKDFDIDIPSIFKGVGLA